MAGLLDPPQTTPSVPITHRTVAFTAYMSADVSGLGPGQGIIFDKVITNVGGGYHAPHGNFIAPTDGVYVFTVMAMEHSGQSEHLLFVKDGVDIAHVYVGATSNYISTSGIITLSLSKGNEVWIPRASWHGTGSLHGVTNALFTSFSGWLIN